MHQAKRDFNKARENECRVDPDRAQLLTDRRNRMIERLDREQREKEEQAAKLLESSAKPSSESEGLTAVQKGDEQAVGDYEKSWERKLSLYGRDELQAQASVGSASAAMNAIRKAQEDAAKEKRTRCETLPRSDSYQEQPLRQDLTSKESDMHEPARVKGRAANVSDFMVSDMGNAKPGSSEKQEIDVMERLSSREQAVWNQPWNMGKKQSEAHAAAAPTAAGGQNDDEVVPEIWQKNNAVRGVEEREIMDRNMKSTQLHREAEKEKNKSLNVTELNDLD